MPVASGHQRVPRINPRPLGADSGTDSVGIPEGIPEGDPEGNPEGNPEERRKGIPRWGYGRLGGDFRTAGSCLRQTSPQSTELPPFRSIEQSPYGETGSVRVAETQYGFSFSCGKSCLRGFF